MEGQLNLFRTAEEEKRKQEKMAAEGWNLSWWYGTDCTKCCDVYPKFMTEGWNQDRCWYECPVCGRKSGKHWMPWQAKEDWNDEARRRHKKP